MEYSAPSSVQLDNVFDPMKKETFIKNCYS